MSLVLFHTDKVRRALAAPASVGIELFVLGGVAAVIGGLALVAERAAAPMPQHFSISLSLLSLPKYTAFTLLRGVVAYLLSLAFTLFYGVVAGHNHRAERVMIPALDVFQSLPVLTFLPGLVLVFVHLFPTRQVGLELVAIITIFTGQVSEHDLQLSSAASAVFRRRCAKRVSGPTALRVGRFLKPARTARQHDRAGLELDDVAWRGGWFFIATVEAFTLKDRDYRLPGLGSYMSEAIKNGTAGAETLGRDRNGGDDRAGRPGDLAADRGLGRAVQDSRTSAAPTPRSRG